MIVAETVKEATTMKKGKAYSKSNISNMLLQLFFFLSFTNVVFANGEVAVPEDVITTLTNITRLLLLVGSAVCIGKIIHIGIMFVTSSAMEKSKAKEAVLPWIIGTIVCFGAATIGGAIVDIFLNAGTPPDVLGY